DLAVVKNVADQVALMRGGRIVETVDAKSFFSAPKRPYARELLGSIPTSAKRGKPLSMPRPAVAVVTTPPTQISGAPLAGEARHKRHRAGAPVLTVSNLSVSYSAKGSFWRRSEPVKIVENVSFTLRAGETLALLGESGCGKTTTAKALLRLLDKQAL